MSGLIFGGGYLGRKLTEELGIPLTYYRVSQKNNIYDPIESMKLKYNFIEHIESQKPDFVINAIGKTGGEGAIGIDWCENNKKETVKSNVSAARVLAEACAKLGVYFVHLGSGCIYNGYPEDGYKEEDTPNMEGQFYALSKMWAEEKIKQVKNLYPNFEYLILRIRMPVDNKPHKRNLITKLLKYPEVIDAPNSMTVIPEAIPVINRLVERKYTGILNFVNPGLISAYEIMGMYQEIVDENHNFSKLSLENLDKKVQAARSNCFLNTDKLQEFLRNENLKMLDIQESVRNCLMEYARCLE